jgi:Skp family chaperone for outer membrane proteins
MRSSILRFVLPGLVLTAVSVNVLVAPVFAQKAATSIGVKIGYFNSNLVKMSDPQEANSESLKNQAEEQLKHDLDEGNKKLQKLRDEKKSDEEIKKTVEQLQIEIRAKQQALAQLVQNNNQMAQDRVRQAANAVAKERGLDIIIDGAGVYSGGQKILDNGVEVTEDVVHKLNPNAPTKAASK